MRLYDRRQGERQHLVVHELESSRGCHLRDAVWATHRRVVIRHGGQRYQCVHVSAAEDGYHAGTIHAQVGKRGSEVIKNPPLVWGV